MPYRFFPHTRRAIAGVMWSCFAMAGVVFIFVPSPAVADEGGSAVLIIWHSFLIVGGLISAVGVVTHRRRIELAGIPLTCAALLAYIVVLVGPTMKGEVSGPQFGVGLIMMAVMMAVVDRAVALWGWIVADNDLHRRGVT